MSLKLKHGGLWSIPTDDFHYDLFRGGYFKPDKFLDEVSAEKVKEAIKIIEEYEELLESNGLLEEM